MRFFQRFNVFFSDLSLFAVVQMPDKVSFFVVDLLLEMCFCVSALKRMLG